MHIIGFNPVYAIFLILQLNQEPGIANPVFTPKSHGEDWLLAKLWVRCVDYHHQLMVSHLLKCSLVIEPFCVATMRQLSSSHPIYKLLKPHFRLLMSVAWVSKYGMKSS